MPLSTPDEAGQAARAHAAGPLSHRVILGAIALFCLVVIGLDGWRSWTARNAVGESERVATENLARSLAQHAQDMLATADALLVSLRDTIEFTGGPRGESGGVPARDAQARHAELRWLLASQIATVPNLRDLMVFGADGFQVVDSGRAAPEVESIADREYYRYHASHTDRGVHFGGPVQGKLDGTWIVVLTRRIDAANGSFGGLVVTTFPVAAFRQFYETFDVGRAGFIGLYTTGSVIVSRYPNEPGQVGRNIVASVVYAQTLENGPFGSYRSVSPVDGVERVGSYRKVETYPLVVVVGRGLEEMLAPWRTEALVHLAISVSTCLIVGMLGLRFAHQLRLQRKAEQDLQRSERQYRLLGDRDTDLIVQLDAGLRHVYASAASRAILGRSPQEMIGRPPSEFVHAQDEPAVSAALSTIAREGAASPFTYRGLHRDGAEVWIEAVGSRLDDGGIILVHRDVSERRRAERQLCQAQRMGVVGQLTAGIAHDFNNLLQAQVGALELLLETVGNDAETVRFATMALGAAEHAAKLTHSLLSFSRQQVLDPAAVLVPSLFARLETMLSRTLGPRIELRIEIEADLPPVLADAAQTEAALLNLALNARDAMPEGGCLTLAACTPLSPTDLPDALEHGRYVVLTVADNGSGMSPDTLAQACEPFFTTKGTGKGSGLGLSMVQGFARQSGGTLRFFSVLGRGTRIEVWLPMAAVAGIKAPVATVRSPARGNGLILLAEDVSDVLLILSVLLENAGFDVVAVSSGEAAIEELTAGRPFSALVTDFAMAGLDGAELTRRARRLRPGLPAMIITGYVDSEKLRDLPADVAVLRKPVDTDALVAAVVELTGSTSKLPARMPVTGVTA